MLIVHDVLESIDPRTWSLLTFIGTCATIFALSLALLERRRAKAMTQKLSTLHADAESIAANTKEIRQATTTRPIGKFPGFIVDIKKLVEALPPHQQTEKNTLHILCDYPGFGVLSEPDAAYLMIEAIRRAATDGTLEVSLICIEEAARGPAVEAQLRKEAGSKNLDEYCQVVLREKVRRFLHLFREDIPAGSASPPCPETMTFDTLTRLWTEIDKKVEVKFCTREGALPVPPAVHMWVANRESEHPTAVFSIPSLSTAAQEFGFRTEEPALIQALSSIFDRYEQMACEWKAAEAQDTQEKLREFFLKFIPR